MYTGTLCKVLAMSCGSKVISKIKFKLVCNMGSHLVVCAHTVFLNHFKRISVQQNVDKTHLHLLVRICR